MRGQRTDELALGFVVPFAAESFGADVGEEREDGMLVVAILGSWSFCTG
jgi:hypothetical protein